MRSIQVKAAEQGQISARPGLLETFWLHRRFAYDVGGLCYTSVEVEHAVLRRGQPRPRFGGAFSFVGNLVISQAIPFCFR